MAANQEVVDRLARQIDELIKDETPDYRFIDSVDFHTHIIEDIPQLQMLFNTGYIDSIYDKYYNEKSAFGFICYNNGMLINFGKFQYNNNALQTEILLPLGYNNNRNYTLQYHKVLDYDNDNSKLAYQPIDNTYDIIVLNKHEYGFTVKSPQLYIPESIKYNYLTIGITNLT